MLEIEHGSSRQTQTAITLDLGVCVRPTIYRDARKWKNKNYREIQMVITFPSDVQFRRIIYQDIPNSTRKPSANSKCHKFLLGYMLEAHDVSRRTKMNNRSSRENQMVFTFQSDVHSRWIIYEDTRNWTWKLSEYSNGHNFWLGSMLEAHDISRRSKMNNISSREIQTVITFDSDV